MSQFQSALWLGKQDSEKILDRKLIPVQFQNNFLWAQMCEILASKRRPAETFSPSDDISLDEEMYGTDTSSVARVLLASFKGQKLMVNGAPLRPRDELNVRDKHLVSQFNFKEAIKKYYIHYIQRIALQTMCFRYTSGTSATSSIEVREYDGKFNDVWAKADLKKHKCAQDVYYYVDFGCSPQKLEKMQQDSVTTPLYSELGGRLVVYQISVVEPRKRGYISRMPARRVAGPVKRMPHIEIKKK